MNEWQKVIDLLNKNKKIYRTTMLTLLDTHHITLNSYLRCLTKAGFIKELSKNTGGKFPLPVYYKLLLKIPKKITYNEAVELSNNPWMTWFKYLELIERK